MGKNDTVLTLNKDKAGDEAASKIETIRNLIFGENIAEYNSEFEALKSDIHKKKKILEDLVEEVRQDLKTAIDNVATDVNIRITELEDKLDERVEKLETNSLDRATLGKLLVDMGEKVSQK